MENNNSNPNSSSKSMSISIPIPRKSTSHLYLLTNGPSSQPSSCFEIRLFYVRVSPCIIETVPEYLTISHLRREIGVSMEINGSKIPSSDRASLTLKRDRVDREASEVTYVSTDSVRVTGAIEFEVYERDDLMLCGSLERMDWGNGNGNGDNTNNNGLEKDAKTGWSMDCCIASGVTSTGTSSFFQPKKGISFPSIEVYVAGCCSGVPLILTKTIQLSPRRKVPRHAALDAIPEDEETGKENGVVRHPNFQVTDAEVDEYDPERKIPDDYHSEGYYIDEDGQLTWFNAGVRVGVGIGLGMCLGIGIGVGLLMRSYQATTRTFRRRFF